MTAAFTLLIILLPLLTFWMAMVRDMLRNDDLPDHLPIAFAWPPISKNQWQFAFLFFSIFAAGYYYFTVYRSNH